METVLVYTATKGRGYTWYVSVDGVTNECDPPEVSSRLEQLLPGGHLPGLAVVRDSEGRICCAISGLLSQREEGPGGRISDTLLLVSPDRQISARQRAVVREALLAPAIDIESLQALRPVAPVVAFARLSAAVTDKGAFGIDGVHIDEPGLFASLDELVGKVEGFARPTGTHLEPGVGADSRANRDRLLRALNGAVESVPEDVIAVVTLGKTPQELRSAAYWAITVHGKAAGMNLVEFSAPVLQQYPLELTPPQESEARFPGLQPQAASVEGGSTLEPQENETAGSERQPSLEPTPLYASGPPSWPGMIAVAVLAAAVGAAVCWLVRSGR